MPETPLAVYMTGRQENLGSICCLARDPRDGQALYLLSAGHVIAPLEASVSAARSTRIRCRFPDGSDREVATLFDWEVLRFGGGQINRFDVGVAEVRPDAAEPLLRQVPLPTGITKLIEENWDVCAFGARSGKALLGRVRERQADPVSLAYYLPGRIEQASFDPSYHFATDEISVKGDSGAPAIDRAGRLMGLLVGGSSSAGRSYFVRIGTVMEWFKLEAVRHAEHPAGTSALTLWEKPGVPTAPAPVADDRSTDVLARTLWGEARGEGRKGMEAVASVVLNRAHRGAGYWWGDSVVTVCKRPYQFSCWNPNDPNRVKLLRVGGEDAAFRTCLEVAQAALSGALADLTDGATHYHHHSIMPQWARGKRPCVRIGSHLFYNDIE